MNINGNYTPATKIDPENRETMKTSTGDSVIDKKKESNKQNWVTLVIDLSSYSCVST